MDGQDLPDQLDGQLDLLDLLGGLDLLDLLGGLDLLDLLDGLDLPDLLDGLDLPEDDDIKNSHCVSNTALVIQTQHGTAVYLKRKNTGYFGCVILT